MGDSHRCIGQFVVPVPVENHHQLSLSFIYYSQLYHHLILFFNQCHFNLPHFYPYSHPLSFLMWYQQAETHSLLFLVLGLLAFTWCTALLTHSAPLIPKAYERHQCGCRPDVNIYRKGEKEIYSVSVIQHDGECDLSGKAANSTEKRQMV